MSRISIMYSPVDYKGNKVTYTKTFLKDGTKLSYGNAYKSYIQDIKISTIDELQEVIELCDKVDGCLTAGQPKKAYISRIRRLIYPDEKGHYKATIKKDTQFSVLIIDIDDKPNPYPVQDFDNHLEYILTQLAIVMPECLDVDFIYQLSSSAGLRDSSNCHLFFLLDESYNYKKITNIFDNFNNKANELNADIQFDNSVNTRTQPIYVTNPIFEKPSLNPLLDRVFTMVGDKRKLTLPNWILKEKEEVPRVIERTLAFNEMLEEITEWHKEGAIKAFRGASSSTVGLGRFVKYLKLKKYTMNSCQALWEHIYDGTNYTLVSPTNTKHKYNKFQDTWQSIPFEEPKYFEISEPLIVSTDTRDNCITIPNWSQKSLIELSKRIIKYKDEKGLSRLPKASIKLNKKVSQEIRNHIEKFAKDNMLRWRII